MTRRFDTAAARYGRARPRGSAPELFLTVRLVRKAEAGLAELLAALTLVALQVAASLAVPAAVIVVVRLGRRQIRWLVAGGRVLVARRRILILGLRVLVARRRILVAGARTADDFVADLPGP